MLRLRMYIFFMQPRSFIRVIWFGLIAMMSVPVFAEPPVKRKVERNDDDVPVFVTGSLIPQRVKLHPTGTKTVSPIRVISRTEIDQNGRPTTPGALINDPAVQAVPFIHH